MEAIIDIEFETVMGMRIISRGNLIQKAVTHAVEDNVKELCKRLQSYFRDKTIETEVKYIMEGKDAQVKIIFLMIGQIPVTKELLDKEKGLMASTENTVKKLCNMLEELFSKKGVRIKTKHKVYGD